MMSPCQNLTQVLSTSIRVQESVCYIEPCFGWSHSGLYHTSFCHNCWFCPTYCWLTFPFVIMRYHGVFVQGRVVKPWCISVQTACLAQHMGDNSDRSGALAMLTQTPLSVCPQREYNSILLWRATFSQNALSISSLTPCCTQFRVGNMEK